MPQPTASQLQAYGRWENPDGSGGDNARADGQSPEQALEIVQRLGDALLDKRKEAMDSKEQTGITREWTEDEEYYQGIDTANPAGETNVGKPISTEGGPIGMPGAQSTPRRSTVFINLTRPFVDGAAARIADMLLPNDEMPWSLRPTPINDEGNRVGTAVPGSEGTGDASGPGGAAMTPVQGAIGQPAAGAPPLAAPNAVPPRAAPGATMPAAPGASDTGGAAPSQIMLPQSAAAPMQVQPGNAAQAVMNDPAQAANSAADPDTANLSPEERAAKAAEKQITDWLIECQYHAEMRKVLESCAKLGTGILKGPVPVVKVGQRMKLEQGTGQMKWTRVESIVPASMSVDPRNFFPDPACGEDVQRGGYTWEYDTLSGRSVQDLLMDDTYIEQNVRKVLREGPARQGVAPADSPSLANIEKALLGAAFGVWYFHGMVERKVLIAAGVPEADMRELESESVPAIITMINDTVVKASLTPLDAGGLPYDVMAWQRRAGMLWGMGVARQMRTPQRMLNAAARALMDNAGFTSGPLWGIREGWVEPIDKSWELTPRKGFRMTSKAPDTAKIGDAISFTNVQAAQAELQAIVNMARQFAEEATGLPMLMQGQQGEASETATGMTILNNNGSTVLRRIARQCDDSITERHIRRYYYWLMENSDNEAAKGDFQIDARGSTTLVERELSNQSLMQLAPLLEADPDIHKQRLHQRLLSAHRIDWKDLYMTPAERQERDAKPQPKPESVQVAEIREKGATDRKGAELRKDWAVHENEMQQQEATLRKDYELGLGALDLQLRAIGQRAGMSDDQITAMLTKVTMELKTQVGLANANRQHEAAQVMNTPAEPPGRARDGQAVTQ